MHEEQLVLVTKRVRGRGKARQLTQLVADLEPEAPRPGVVGLGAGGRHAPPVLPADLELRRAGRRRRGQAAGDEHQQQQSEGPRRHVWNSGWLGRESVSLEEVGGGPCWTLDWVHLLDDDWYL